MKHLWIGVSLLICLLVAGGISSYGVQQAQKPLTEQLEQAADMGFQEDWAQAQKHFAAAQTRWEKYRKFLAAFVDHEPMEEIDSFFGQTELYIQAKDPVLFAGVCRRLSQLTEAIGEAHRLSWWNLL